MHVAGDLQTAAQKLLYWMIYIFFKYETFIIVLFTFFIFDLSANDQIITDKVYEKIEASLAQEQSRN